MGVVRFNCPRLQILGGPNVGDAVIRAAGSQVCLSFALWLFYRVVRLGEPEKATTSVGQ